MPTIRLMGPLTVLAVGTTLAAAPCVLDPTDGTAENGLGPPTNGPAEICQLVPEQFPGCAVPPGLTLLPERIDLGLTRTAADRDLAIFLRVREAPSGHAGPPGDVVFEELRNVAVPGLFPAITTESFAVPPAFPTPAFACVEWDGAMDAGFFVATDESPGTPPANTFYRERLDVWELVRHVDPVHRAAFMVVTAEDCDMYMFFRSGEQAGGHVGAFYSHQLFAASLSPPFTFTVVSGTLPPGVLMSGDGWLLGTPGLPGTFTSRIRVVDSAGCVREAEITISISEAGCPPVLLTPPTIPPLREGRPVALDLDCSAEPCSFAAIHGLPPGLMLDGATGLLSGTPLQAGTYEPIIVATDSGGCRGFWGGGAQRQTFQVVVRPAVDFLVGEGLGPSSGNRVSLWDASGAATPVDFLAYGAGQWGTNVASGDIDGLVYDDILTGPGPGPVYGPQVRAFDRLAGAIGKVSFYAYGTLRYGVNVGAADTEADGFHEILTGAGSGAVFGPHVRAWNFDGGTLAPIGGVNFFAYQTLRYGVKVVGGDLDADGHGELATAPGPSGSFSSQVRGWNVDGAAATSISRINFLAFPGSSHGANVALGDADGDGAAELVAARGPAAGSDARVLGFDVDAGGPPVQLPGFDITPFATRHGARVGMGDADGDTRSDLVAGAGPDPTAGSTVRSFGYDGTSLSLQATFLPFGGNFGVNVTAGELGFF